MSKKQSSEVLSRMQKLLVSYAREANEWVRFSERDRKLRAESFVQMLVLGWLKTSDASLNELAHNAKDLGIRITGSGIHQRLNGSGVMLLAAVLKRALEDLQGQCPLPMAKLSQFKGVYITDSTQIALPKALASTFRGAKANGMVKLQVTWDYLNGNLATIELEQGRSSDRGCQLHVAHAQAQTLQLFDLGYFKQEHLRDIDQQEAFFVSRYQSQTALYDCESRERVDLTKWLRKQVADEVDLSVLLGARVKHPVRMVARRLPKKVAAARRRKARKKARTKGQTASQTHLYLQGWEIILTNLSPQDWSTPQLFDLYGIRFQIEWVFHIWKDQLGLDEIVDWHIERVLCQLYAHLLAALLTHLLTARWRWADVEYSFLKCVQVIQKTMQDLMRCLARDGFGLQAWLKRLEDDFRSFATKTKRRTSPSTLQIVNNWD